MKITVKIERKEVVGFDEIRGAITLTDENGKTLLEADTCELFFRHLPAGTYEGKICESLDSILGLGFKAKREWKIVTSVESHPRLPKRIVVGKIADAGLFFTPTEVRDAFYQLLLGVWLNSRVDTEWEVEISALPQPSPTGEGDQDNEDED